MPPEPDLRAATLTLFLLASAIPSGAAAACPELAIDVAGRMPDTRAGEFRRWLCDVAGSVGSVSGQFPVPAARVTLLPATDRGWGSDRAVVFGRVRRTPVPSIELFADLDRPIEDFYGDWTATHEFSHLLLPRLDTRQRWISEGFATYYQNVLMARAGNYTPEQALQNLVAGFTRGIASRPDLSPNEAAHAGIGRARMKIYWSGAAIALLADVQLREHSGGAESLDTVLARFQACCLPTRKRWSGAQLFERLDTLAGTPVFMPLYRQYADSPGFPDIEAALENERTIARILAVRTSPH